MSAVTYRFLVLVGEYDRRRGCERHGLVSTAQWLNWQCGIDMATAQQKVRTARALESLPKISEAFARGEISYSKVRAMTRVATAATESVLLNVARHGMAAHVEKLVRKYRWTQRRDAAKAGHEQHLNREVHSFYDDTGTFVLYARLPAEIGAVVLKALQVAADLVRAKEPKAESAGNAGKPEKHEKTEVPAEPPCRVATPRRTEAWFSVRGGREGRLCFWCQEPDAEPDLSASRCPVVLMRAQRAITYQETLH